MKDKFAKVYWTIEDVIETTKNMNTNGLDIKLTKKEAEEFIKNNEERIKNAMTETGWEVIEDELLLAKGLR